ncbi:MarR family transcriptional regulator [Streptococcus pneumoniae]|nr:MarR family transcriptional regulator [Streptococcus pneumoniae]
MAVQERLKIDQTALTRHFKILETEGLVERHRNPENQREVLVEAAKYDKEQLVVNPPLQHINPNHSYLSQLDVTYKTPDLMSHFLPPHEVSFTFCCSSIVFPR